MSGSASNTTADFFISVRNLFREHHTVPALLLLCLACVFASIRITLVPLTPNSDTTQYVETARLFAGDEDAPVHGNRLLKPLAPFAMTTLSPLFGDDYLTALEVLSIGWYLLIAIIIYFFAHHFLGNKGEAFIASLIYLTSYPMLMYGLDLYTETGAWCLHLLGLYFAVRYYHTPHLRFVALAAISTTVGFLWKEYAALSGLALGVLIVLANTPWRTKMQHLLFAALLTLPILIWWQTYVYLHYDYTYLDWFITGHGEPETTSQFSLFYIAKSMFALLLLGWVPVLAGLARWRTFAREDRIPGLVVALTSLGFLSWGYVSSRLYFVLAPTLTTLAARGVMWPTSWVIRFAIVGVVIVSNLGWLIISNIPDVRAWLVSL